MNTLKSILVGYVAIALCVGFGAGGVWAVEHVGWWFFLIVAYLVVNMTAVAWAFGSALREVWRYWYYNKILFSNIAGEDFRKSATGRLQDGEDYAFPIDFGTPVERK